MDAADGATLKTAIAHLQSLTRAFDALDAAAKQARQELDTLRAQLDAAKADTAVACDVLAGKDATAQAAPAAARDFEVAFAGVVAGLFSQHPPTAAKHAPIDSAEAFARAPEPEPKCEPDVPGPREAEGAASKPVEETIVVAQDEAATKDEPSPAYESAGPIDHAATDVVTNTVTPAVEAYRQETSTTTAVADADEQSEDRSGEDAVASGPPPLPATMSGARKPGKTTLAWRQVDPSAEAGDGACGTATDDANDVARQIAALRNAQQVSDGDGAPIENFSGMHQPVAPITESLAPDTTDSSAQPTLAAAGHDMILDFRRDDADEAKDASGDDSQKSDADEAGAEASAPEPRAQPLRGRMRVAAIAFALTVTAALAAIAVRAPTLERWQQLSQGEVNPRLPDVIGRSPI